jgi:hypothetical protein
MVMAFATLGLAQVCVAVFSWQTREVDNRRDLVASTVQCHVTLMPSAHSTSPAGCPSCFRAWHGWPTLPPSTRPLPVGCRSRYSRAGPLAAPDVRRVTQRTVVLYVGVWMVDRCRGTAPTTTRATLRPPVRRRAVVPCGKQAVGCIRYRESSQNNALILNTTVTNLMLCLLVGFFKVQSHNTQPVATCRNLLQPVATCCNLSQPVATCRNLLQPVATCCNLLRHSATRCNTPFNRANYCDTLQRGANPILCAASSSAPAPRRPHCDDSFRATRCRGRAGGRGSERGCEGAKEGDGIFGSAVRVQAGSEWVPHWRILILRCILLWQTCGPT